MPEPQPRVVIASRNQIGESPLWWAAENALYWVDVEGRLIQRWAMRDQSVQRWQMAEPVGCIGLRKRGGLVGASRAGFFFFLDVASGTITPIADPKADQPDNRFNDGKVDRRGRFWAGTRNFRDHSKPSGALYRLDADLSIHRMEEGLGCPNGMAWSPDDRLMYLCDTWARKIFVYDFAVEEGVPHNRRLFAELKEAEGFPDGLTVDTEGSVWNAHYNGWRITRYAPDGCIERVLRMPVQHVTSLTFGGADSGTLYVTSAALRLSDEERKRQPLAGHVLRWRQDAAFQNRSSPAEQRSGRAWRTPNVCLISASGGRDPSISSRLMLLPSPPSLPSPAAEEGIFFITPSPACGGGWDGAATDPSAFPLSGKN